MARLVTSRQRIQHLLRRAGFGYQASELEEYALLGFEGAVERLLNPEKVNDSATDAVLASILEPMAGNPDDRDVDRVQREALYRAWYVRISISKRPLLERMTYFWHDHFATSQAKVQKATYMQQQNETLRRHALGSFRELLLAMAQDPAMLMYLDNRLNVRGKPNENYARELMELHTLGVGTGYKETDIKEAARALTGWRIENHKAVFKTSMFDSGEKTILGSKDNFNHEKLVDLLAGDRRTAAHLADKLVRYFVRPDGEAALTRRATDEYMKTGGSMRDVMRTILLSEAMYSDGAYRAIIKSPTELVCGTQRALEIATDGRAEKNFASPMGQVLYEPPNPAGWSGDGDWVNATTVLARSNYAQQTTVRNSKSAADVAVLLRRYGATTSAAAVVDFTLDLLVGGDTDATTRTVLIEHIGGANHFNFEQAARDGSLQGMMYLALSMPLYQVA